MPATLTPDQIDRLTSNLCSDPFEFLGPQQIERNGTSIWAIRALIPNAKSVSAIERASQKKHPMQQVHHEAYFELELAPGQDVFDYQFEVERSWGEVELVEDPYCHTGSRLSEIDLHLYGEGNHHRIYDKLGAHLDTLDGVKGVSFAVWAPNARNVSVLGDFNHWDGRQHQMRPLGSSGIWGLFVPNVVVGASYKYEIKNHEGHIYEKSDPFGFQQEIRPNTASIVADLSTYDWHDAEWVERRTNSDPLKQPISVYEVHPGSWQHTSSDIEPPAAEGKHPAPIAMTEYKENTRFLSYRELADKLVPYVKDLGYTHIELLPVAEHPYDGSWGYQVIGYYAATSRYGSPQDLMYFIDRCHQEGIGVIIDWVPGHFPKDGHGLASFDGTHLYEHGDPRKGEHKTWGTLVFNYSRNEVRNFLTANVLFWFEKYHIDGIRVDAVASMLYNDYEREEGEWLANEYGGRENIEAIEFLKQLNHLIFQYYPGALSIAEESTDWPMVTWPTHVGGLGFNLKWNMGWMHDMLDYFSMDPWFRQFHQNLVTFSIMYAFNENFMLALSHDEVVHGKSNIIGKIPGDDWGKFASMRCLYGYMFTHPGKQTMFMGMEFGQWHEWNVWDDLQWELTQYDSHAKLRDYIRSLNQLASQEPALYTNDFDYSGFQWIDCSDTSGVISFLRRGADDSNEFVVVVCNFAPVVRSNYRIGVPESGYYDEVLNSDATVFWGSGAGNLGGKFSDDIGYHNQPYSLDLCLPMLSTLVLKLRREESEQPEDESEA